MRIKHNLHKKKYKLQLKVIKKCVNEELCHIPKRILTIKKVSILYS